MANACARAHPYACSNHRLDGTNRKANDRSIVKTINAAMHATVSFAASAPAYGEIA